jgi:hypothetical protein
MLLIWGSDVIPCYLPCRFRFDRYEKQKKVWGLD